MTIFTESQRQRQRAWWLAAIIFVTMNGCSSQPHTTTATNSVFKVGIATWPGFGPGFVAKEKGFFGKLQVDLIILDDFSARQAAFTSGQTQATISTLDSFAFESAKGVQGKVVMILDESFGADGIVAKPEITKAADLVGKRVAFTKGSPSHFFLMVYLQKNGLSLKDLQTLEVDDPGRAGEAFVSGSVDAAVTWEPNISQIVQSSKGHVLDSTKLTPGMIVDVMVASPAALSSRSADIQVFVNGWMQALDFVKQQPDEAYKIMAPALKIPPNEFPRMAQGLRYADRDMNRRWLTDNDGKAAVALFDQAVGLWRAAGIIQNAPVGSEHITNEFIRRVP